MRLLILTSFFLLYQSVVLACDFKIINFGDSQDKIKIDPAPITFPDRFGGDTEYQLGIQTMVVQL